MTKNEFKALVAGLADDYWEGEQEMIDDMKADGEESPLPLEQRGFAMMMVDFCERLTVIYADEARMECARAIKANARLANPYR